MYIHWYLKYQSLFKRWNWTGLDKSKTTEIGIFTKFKIKTLSFDTPMGPKITNTSQEQPES